MEIHVYGSADCTPSHSVSANVISRCHFHPQRIALLCVVMIASGSFGQPNVTKEEKTQRTKPLLHSYARPNEVATRHLQLDLSVDFTSKTLTGTATYELERHTEEANELWLDSDGLDIKRVTDSSGRPLAFRLGPNNDLLGSSLVITLTADTRSVCVEYATRPSAEALQWLSPAQTSGNHPFLFTQSQAILARTWIPLPGYTGSSHHLFCHGQGTASIACGHERGKSDRTQPIGCVCIRNETTHPDLSRCVGRR